MPKAFVKVRFSDFSRTTAEVRRQRARPGPPGCACSTGARAQALPVRLLGVGVRFAEEGAASGRRRSRFRSRNPNHPRSRARSGGTRLTRSPRCPTSKPRRRGRTPPRAAAACGPPTSTGGASARSTALWEHAAGARPLLLYAFLLLLASQLFKLAVPWLAGNAINQIQSGGLEGMSEAGRWLGMVFAAIVASWLLHGPGRILERNVALKVRERLSALLVGPPARRAAGLARAPPLPARPPTACSRARTLYDFAQSQFIYLQNTVRLVGPIVALWLISPLVGAVALVGYGLIGLLITRFDRVMMRVAVEENRAERAYSATLVDVLGNVLSVLALRRGGAWRG